MDIKEWYIDEFKKFMNRGGKRVTDEHEKERREVCNGCEFKVLQKPQWFLPKMESCKLCGCPLDTKAAMLDYFRKVGNELDPLTALEILEVRTMKSFDSKKYKKVTIRCPHKDGDKWESIDRKFNY